MTRPAHTTKAFLNAAEHAMTARQRKAFTLRIYEGETWANIGATLGIDERAAQRLFNRGIQATWRHLDDAA